MRKFALLIILILALCLTAGAQTPPTPQPTIGAAAPRPAASADVRRESFDIVWRTVKEKHFDPQFGGVDWEKVREKYAPRLATIKTDAELYTMLQQMLGELHQSHFQIIPPEAVIQAESGDAGGGIGIDLRMIDNQAVVTRVEADSAAARAGLRSGFVITEIDGTRIGEIAKRLTRSPERPAMVKLYLERALLGRIRGSAGSTVRIGFLDQADQPHQASIARTPRGGEMSPAFGNFPPQYTEFEAKRLAGNIGYIRFNIFVASLMSRIRAAIREMSDAPGIIIDLRGNPGGLGGMSTGIAGLLESQQTSLGVMKLRGAEMKFIVFPQSNPYLGKLVLLTDGASASTSEVFASGLQELGRATVVGERSLGAALPSVIQKLPTGALFQYAIADFKTPKGILVEGRGVIPDREVKLTRRALLEGRDAQLEAAVEGILK